MYWENVPGRAKPPYLDLCLETIKRHIDPGMPLRVLDETTVFDWLQDLSPEDWKKLGSPVRRSDFARVRLLDRHGGLWLDADCIAMSSLGSLVEPLDRNELVGWGGDVGEGWFYNGLFAARAGATFLQKWIAAQDALLAAHADWERLSWAALGQGLMRDLVGANEYYNIPRLQIAPVLFYEWRRFLSPMQSPARVLDSAPITVMLWNREMERDLGGLPAQSVLSSKMLIGRLFRISLGLSTVDEERDLATRISLLSDLRFSARGRSVEYRLRSLLRLRKF
jgi:hypothetical protein